MAISGPKERMKEHAYEHNPPRQEKRVNPQDDNWGLATTSLDVTNSKVSSDKGDAVAFSIAGEYPMRPNYNDQRSALIVDSRTNGKKG